MRTIYSRCSRAASSVIKFVFISWLIVGFALFFVLPPRRALLVGFVFGYLFLPYASIDIWALHTRDGILCFPLLLGSVLFGWKAWERARFCFVDVAMAAWCLCPLLSSLTNGLGLYNSLSHANFQLQEWGIPYVLGRIFFFRLEHLRQLAIAIFIGGLVYVPLCWWEIRMSPQLHFLVYGFYPHAFAQAFRYGGFRPTVFLGHGLGVAMWLAFSGVTGFWLWSSRSLRTLGRIPTGPLLAVLVSTLVLCKSVGPMVVFAISSLFKVVSKTIRSSALVWLLVSLPAIYVVLRLEGKLPTETVNSISSQVLDQERTGSLTFRLENEELMVQKALERPWLGWGGWGRWRVHDRFGRDLAVSDALWAIELGQFGFFGLVSLALVYCVPVLMFFRRYPGRVWAHPKVAPAASLAIFMTLSQIDALFNTPDPPILMLAAGGITAVASASLRQLDSKRAASAWHGIQRARAQSPG
jgi:hypothetical protein